jgi:hypothetical protein
MDERTFKDYFSDTDISSPIYFNRRYRMGRLLFLTLLERVHAYDRYFF